MRAALSGLLPLRPSQLGGHLGGSRTAGLGERGSGRFRGAQASLWGAAQTAYTAGQSGTRNDDRKRPRPCRPRLASQCPLCRGHLPSPAGGCSAIVQASQRAPAPPPARPSHAHAPGSGGRCPQQPHAATRWDTRPDARFRPPWGDRPATRQADARQAGEAEGRSLPGLFPLGRGGGLVLAPGRGPQAAR